MLPSYSPRVPDSPTRPLQPRRAAQSLQGVEMFGHVHLWLLNRPVAYHNRREIMRSSQIISAGIHQLGHSMSTHLSRPISTLGTFMFQHPEKPENV